MRALVVFESMFGNTRAVAEAVAEGIGPGNEVLLVPAGEAGDMVAEDVDLVVVGGPTHVHGMSRRSTRAAAPEYVRKAEGALHLDPAAEGPGVREWLHTVGAGHAMAAAFDTRMKMPAVVTGRAATVIRRRLRRAGYEVVGPAESFFVDRANHLLPGELDRAREWGTALARRCA